MTKESISLNVDFSLELFTSNQSCVKIAFSIDEYSFMRNQLKMLWIAISNKSSNRRKSFVWEVIEIKSKSSTIKSHWFTIAFLLKFRFSQFNSFAIFQRQFIYCKQWFLHVACCWISISTKSNDVISKNCQKQIETL